MTDPTEALADRLFRDAAGALELYTIYLGERLGLYRALHEGGPATSGELAARTGTNERYVREWLEHHAASGLLDVDDVAADPLARRFSLPAAHAPVLVDRDDARFGAYRAIDIVRAARPLPDLVDAFRNGTAPRRCPGSRRAGPPTTARCIWLTWATSGCPRSPTSTAGCAPTRRRGWPTWPVGWVGRASRSHGPTHWSKWRVSTSTRRRSRPPSTPPRRRGWRTGCRSPSPTPRIRGCPAGSTW